VSATFVAPAELNIYAAAQACLDINAALSALAAGDDLRIDLAAVTELDAAGLQVLLAAAQSAQRGGPAVSLTGADAAMRRRFAGSGVERLLAADDQAAVLAATHP